MADTNQTKPKGIPEPWEKAGSLTIVSGKLYVGDGQMAPHQPGIIVDLPPDTFEIFVQETDYAGDRRNSRLRIVKPDTTFSLGPELGESWADTGTQGLCDLELYKAAIPADEAEYFSAHED